MKLKIYFEKENIKEWKDLHSKIISDIEKNLLKEKEYGSLFEEFNKLYFIANPRIKDDYKNVWLYEEVPLEIKEKLNFGNVEHGVDLLLESKKGEFIAVQSKFRSDENSSLSWSKDKIANLFAYGSKCDGFIVFSNVSKLDNVSLNAKNNFQFISIDNLLEIKEETFEIFKNYLQSGIVKGNVKYKPKKHQKKAIKKVINYFKENDRGQLILPCGAGKTLTALWIKENLKAKNTLVLLPSLALLKQIKSSWNEQKRKNYDYICVCSEKDINSEDIDSPVYHTYEIGGKVTTDEEEILNFINDSDENKVIFSTYQSLEKIKLALKNNENFSFDLVICDEAHRTAGSKSAKFSLIHLDENIKAKKRLYMTATPKVVSEKLKKSNDRVEDFLYDMSDEKIFGNEAFRMSFKDAIDENILVDYKILGIGVTDEQLADYLENRNFVTENETISDYANNYALDLVMEKYKASHAISFHSRVSFAESFSLRHKKLFESTYSQYVSGKQTTASRNLILNDFKNKPKGLVSNARCLTEGVDVPTIDLVYFADPKNSKIDIVQASGRALRIDKTGNKKLGYIVVPVFHHKNKDIEQAIDDGVFKNLVNVIRSLCDQDERLQDEINKIAFEKGKRQKFSDKVEISFGFDVEEKVVNLVGFEEKLRNALFDQVIEKASSNWGVKYESLKLWREIYPDRWTQQIPPKRRKENTPAIIEENSLGVWIMEIRKKYRNGILEKNWIDRLNEIDFIWDSNVARQENFEYKLFEKLKKYLDKNDNLPQSGNMAKGLINRIDSYKNNEIISSALKNILDEYDYSIWIKEYENRIEERNKNMKTWDELLQEVIDFKNKYKKWPTYNSRKDNKTELEIYSGKLAIWLTRQRQDARKGVLEKDKVNNLIKSGIDISSAESKNEKIWDKKLSEVVAWKNKMMNWPKSQFGGGIGKEGLLGNWLQSQVNWYRGNLSKYGSYPEERKKKLLEVDFDLDDTTSREETLNKRWNIQFENLKEFKEINNRWPRSTEEFPKGNKLGVWIGNQKDFFKNNKLKKDRVDKFLDIGFDLKNKKIRISVSNNIGWKKQFENLKEFKRLNGRWPKFNEKFPEGNRLGVWLSKQKMLFKENKLSDNRIKKLKSLNFDFSINLIKKPWEIQFNNLQEFKKIKGRFPKYNEEYPVGNKLGQWLRNQKFKQDKLSKEKVNKFKKIGLLN